MMKGKRPSMTRGNGQRRWVLLVIFCGLSSGWVGCSSSDGKTNLRVGELLADGVQLQAGRLFPYEPMSATSGKCAFELFHRASGDVFYVFPYSGEDSTTVLDVGDLIAPDGSHHIPEDDRAPPQFSKGFDVLQSALANQPFSATRRLCHGLSTVRTDANGPIALLWMGILLLIVAVVFRGSRGKLAFACFFLGVGSLVLGVAPVLLHGSHGSQEVQRLLSAALPLDLLIAGHHGDVRHPRLLFILYGAVVHFSPSVVALRLFSFGVFVAGLLAFGVWGWLRSPCACVMAASLLLHPLLLLQITEIGPLALYMAGVLGLVHRMGSEKAWDTKYFMVTLALHIFLSACNVVSYMVGTAVVFVALFRARSHLDGKLWTGHLKMAGLVSFPFIFGVLDVLVADLPMRAASSFSTAGTWGARPGLELARGLAVGLFGDVWLASVILAVGLVWIILRRDFKVRGLFLWALGLLVPAAFLMVSGLNRVQPAYASYGVPLVLVGVGYLTQHLGRRLAHAVLIVIMCLLGMQLTGVYSSVAAPPSIPVPERMMANELKAQAETFGQVLTLSRELIVPLVPYLEKMSEPVEPVRQVKDVLEDFPDARLRTPANADVKIYTLYVRHNLPSKANQQHKMALDELRSHGAVAVLYDTRLPKPQIYAHLYNECAAPTTHPPYALFRCLPKL